MQIIKKLNRMDQQIFIEWVQNVLVSGLPKKRAEELKEEVERRMQGKEDSDMVYALGEAVKNEFLKYEKKLKEASEKGIEKTKIEVIIKAAEKGLKFEDIADITGVTLNEVERIISEHKN